MAEPAKLMIPVEYAAYRGVGKSAVSNWKAKGLLIWAEGASGQPMIDVARTDARLNAKIDPTRGRPRSKDAAAPLFEGSEQGAAATQAPPPAANRLGDIRTELLEQQAIGQRMKNAERAKLLVPLEEATRRQREGGRMARERVHAVIRANSERLAAIRDPREITALLSGAVDKAFADLADQVASGVVLEVAEIETDDADLLAVVEDAEAVEGEDD